MMRQKNENRRGIYQETWLNRLGKDLRVNYPLYLIALPGILFYIIFAYVPMYGAIIAFKDYSPALGILGSKWVGLEHFRDFFTGMNFERIVRNTVLLNCYLILFGFPAPIILALLLNEVKNKLFKRTIQTITYMPHFISSHQAMELSHSLLIFLAGNM